MAMSPADYLTVMLRGILPRPEALTIEGDISGGVTVLIIHLPREDRCFVVGKRGRNIAAVRDLLRAYGGRRGQTIVTKLPDESTPTEATDGRSGYREAR